MVTVGIVIVLVSIAVPPILRSRVVANEGAALGNLKTLNTACQAYHMDQGRYPESLAELGSANPPYIDEVLAAGTKQGYNFLYNSADADHFTVNANCAHTGLLRGRYFFIDESAAIRAKTDGPAGADDEIIG
jgi:type II secretory pathway pseudopilin PulG